MSSQTDLGDLQSATLTEAHRAEGMPVAVPVLARSPDLLALADVRHVRLDVMVLAVRAVLVTLRMAAKQLHGAIANRPAAHPRLQVEQGNA